MITPPLRDFPEKPLGRQAFLIDKLQRVIHTLHALSNLPTTNEKTVLNRIHRGSFPVRIFAGDGKSLQRTKVVEPWDLPFP